MLLLQFYKNIYLCDIDLDPLSIIASMATCLLHSQLKRLHFISLLMRLSVYQTQAFLLGILITFVNTLHFNYLCIYSCNVCVFYFCIFSITWFIWSNLFYYISYFTLFFLNMLPIQKPILLRHFGLNIFIFL